jgi:hypothetical protein
LALTQRFGLTHFGLGVDGSLFEDGGKFTGRDRRVIDRVLHALEAHDHSGGARVEDPEAVPTLELLSEGGSLPAGVTFYYRVSFIDRFGLESAAGPEVSVSTPGPVEIPAPPRVEAKPGGELDPGLYWYALSVHAGGNETQLSPPSVIGLSDWLSVAIGSPNDFPEGAEEVSVWRQGPLDSGFTRLVTMPIPTDPLEFFLDDGSIASDPCACDPENLPPEENLTNATSSVVISLPSSEVGPATGVRRWRVYRSDRPGEYDAASLVAEVVETTEEAGGALVNEFLDTGLEAGPGSPLEVSQTLQPSVLIEAASGGGSGHVFLSSPVNGGVAETWRVMASVGGQLETRTTGLSTPVELPALILVDSDANYWRVTVAPDGALVTTEAPEPEPGDRVHAHGAGPHLPTGDAAVTWRLEVELDGSLTTVGDPVPGTDLLYLLPVDAEPAAPPTGGVLYLLDGELTWKDASGATTTLA